jgi:hypothetical protein
MPIRFWEGEDGEVFEGSGEPGEFNRSGQGAPSGGAGAAGARFFGIDSAGAAHPGPSLCLCRVVDWNRVRLHPGKVAQARAQGRRRENHGNKCKSENKVEHVDHSSTAHCECSFELAGMKSNLRATVAQPGNNKE